MSEPLPRQVNVMQVVTYDVEQVVREIRDPDNGWLGEPDGEVTLQMVLDYLDQWVVEDFTDTSDLLWKDENGNDL